MSPLPFPSGFNCTLHFNCAVSMTGRKTTFQISQHAIGRSETETY